MSVIVGAYQNLLDLAIQQKGTVKAAFEMAMLNDLSITSDLEAGTVINDAAASENIEIKAFYQTNALKPASALDAAALFNSNPTGIDYMIIGTDFIVE